MSRHLDVVARLAGPGSVGRYAAIGLTGMTLDFVLYALLVGIGVVPWTATGLSTSAGIANNYVLNSKLNFLVPPSWAGALRFFTVGIAGLAASVIGVALLTGMGIGALSAKVITLPVVLMAQFFANKYWSFKDSAIPAS